MAPENTVSLVSFWIPTFQFIMSFIPGVYHIYVLIRNWRAKKQERKRQQKTQNMEDSISNTSLRNQQVFSEIRKLDKKADKFKFTIGIITEILGVITLCLTLLLFLCSTGKQLRHFRTATSYCNCLL